MRPDFLGAFFTCRAYTIQLLKFPLDVKCIKVKERIASEENEGRNRMKKKSVSILLAITLSFSILSGCNGNSTKENGTSSVNTEKNQGEAEKKHVENLIIGTTAENNVFNALSQKDAFGRMNYNGLTQGNFVYRDGNNEIQPYFWKSFEISEDGKQIDFTIPLDAVWHDGEKVTMDDLVFTFEYMRDVKKVGSLKNLQEVKITGEDSASLIFSEPDAYYWINSSCNNNACVYAKHIWEGIEDSNEKTDDMAAIGCGPYKLVSYDKDSQVSYYEAVPENDFLGEITVDKVTVQSYSDESALMMAMMNGEIDAMFNYANPVDATVMDTVLGNKDIDPGESPFSGCNQLEYGKDRAPGNDKAFREAVSYALDYEQLASTINGKYGKIPGRGIIPPSCKGYDESLPMLECDVKKAENILDEAGYKDLDGDGYRELPDGGAMDVSVTPQYSSQMDMDMRIAEVIMKSLDDIGVKNHIDQESLANGEVWEDNMTKGNYDLSITMTTSGMASYSTAFRYFLGTLREGESSWIWGTVRDQEIIDTYYAMTEAISDEDYIENCKKLQKYASDTVFAQALCWETAFFPYRTDKYIGWENYPSWGVINCRTWFDLEQK